MISSAERMMVAIFLEENDNIQFVYDNDVSAISHSCFSLGLSYICNLSKNWKGVSYHLDDITWITSSHSRIIFGNACRVHGRYESQSQHCHPSMPIHRIDAVLISVSHEKHRDPLSDVDDNGSGSARMFGGRDASPDSSCHPSPRRRTTMGEQCIVHRSRECPPLRTWHYR